jgi:hypothetical protein
MHAYNQNKCMEHTRTMDMHKYANINLLINAIICGNMQKFINIMACLNMHIYA